MNTDLAKSLRGIISLGCGGNEPPHPLLAEAAAEIDRLQSALGAAEASKDGAYLERNQCVALIAGMALMNGWKAGRTKTAIEGWSEDWHGCVYINTPSGQISWHFHDSQASLFKFLPPYAGTYDGHDTPTKYERVAAEAETCASSSALAEAVQRATEGAIEECANKIKARGEFWFAAATYNAAHAAKYLETEIRALHLPAPQPATQAAIVVVYCECPTSFDGALPALVSYEALPGRPTLCSRCMRPPAPKQPATGEGEG